MQGYILIAIGNEYYAKLAYQLALSIKLNAPDSSIALVHNYGNLSFIPNIFREFVDIEIPAKSEYYVVNGRLSPGKLKLYLDKLTPFEKTVYIDADSVALRCGDGINNFHKTISHFSPFNITYESGEFNWQNKSALEHEFWVKFKEVVGLDTFSNNSTNALNCQSSVIAFSKTDSAFIFDYCRWIHDKLINMKNWIWYRSVPDELCFWLSFIKYGVRLGENIGNKILFWSNGFRFENNGGDKLLYTIPSALSNVDRTGVWCYNEHIKWYCAKAKINPLTMWVDKKNIARTRAFLDETNRGSGRIGMRFN